jgi:hypothetical protein
MCVCMFVCIKSFILCGKLTYMIEREREKGECVCEREKERESTSLTLTTIFPFNYSCSNEAALCMYTYALHVYKQL